MRRAYAGWAAAGAGERGRAYVEFLRALEREEDAARVYGELLAEQARVAAHDVDAPAVCDGAVL